MSESGENTDEWITQYRELLDKNRIDWAFWPYKKMDSPRSVVSSAGVLGTRLSLTRNFPAPSSAQPLGVVRCAVKLRAGFVKFELSVLGDFGCLAQQRSAL